MNALLFAALVAVQQAPPAQAPIPLSPGGRQPANAHDSTVRSIAVIGQRVAEVKSALGQFRRAAFNAQDPQVVQWGDRLGRRCQQLKEQVRAAPRTLCRSCLSGNTQAAVERYRAVLPQLGAAAEHCETSLRQLRRDSTAATARNLRREVRNVGNRIVAGIRPYEERLARVREAFGWSVRGTPAPRASRRS